MLVLGIGIIALVIAGRMNAQLLASRQAYGLDHAPPLENAPPLVVFSTVALGGFSGIIADVLWLRAGRLQMDGQYFELVQLADWITKLEPRFAQGWIYHAWNLSYNISVQLARPEDRWRWVRHGIELLRDGGLRYNPSNAQMYRELGWLFQHKIGANMDQAHMYYKFSWAIEMARLFDGPRPEYDLYARIPASRAEVMLLPGMDVLVERIRAETGYDVFSYTWPEGDTWSSATALMREHEHGAILLHHIRLRIMRDRYRLDPVLMQRVEDEVGPLDWRLHQAHAIYWAWRGRAFAEGFERKAIDRMIFQNMADAFRQGRFFYNADEDLFIPSPHPDILPFVLQAYEEALEEHPDGSMQTAHKNFMTQAMVVLYTYHRVREARALFDTIHARYPSDETAQGFEAFVVSTFVERMQDLSDIEAHGFVEGAFYQSFFWSALGDDERAAGFDRLARLAWNTYMEPRLSNEEFAERTGLPPIPVIRQMALREARRTVESATARSRLNEMPVFTP